MQLDNDELRNYEQKVFLEKDKSNLNPISIFFAVLAAILVAWFLRTLYIEYQIRRVTTAFTNELKVMEEQRKIQMQNLKIRSEHARAEAQLRSELNAEKLLQQKMLERQLEIEKQAEKIEILEEKANKIKAWNVYYKPSKSCESGNDNVDLIKCGNEHAKARKSFEAAWLKAD